jgi:AraC-like DNA-binding protein
MAVRGLYSGELISIDEFACPPGDRAWRSVNVIQSAYPTVVFPRVHVTIRHVDDEPVLATPNLVMLYNPGQHYERRLRSPRGDECLVMRLCAPDLQREFASTHAPSSREAYLRQHLLGRYLRAGGSDALLVEETAVRLVQSVLAPCPSPAPSRAATRRAHRELAEAAKERLATSVGGLHELAGALAVSPFHLARVFRRETGFSLHEYRMELRLRLALDRLKEGLLTPLAFELGFASHSHLTDAFRRAFGVAPSVVRDDVHVRRLLAEAGTNAEAPPPSSS